MADVYNYIVPTGTITVDATDIQDEVIAEYKDVFGADLVVTPQTPQGALIVTETLARIAVADNNATLANQINPNLAGGVFLDAILALTGSMRVASTPSTVTCTITGIAGTSVPAGSQASETGSGNNNLFELTETVVIPTGGTLLNVPFQSVVDGPIPAEASTLTQIVSDVLGWETVTNPDAAIPGQSTQSDIAARLLRNQTLFSQGSSLAGAIIAAVTQVDGVKSLSFIENIAGTTETIEGVTMVGHSIYLCVDGGNVNDIASAIVSKKSGGCAYNNGASMDPQSITVIEPFSGQSMDVLFDLPDVIEIVVRATVSANSSIQNPTSAVTQAILDYAAGKLNGEAGLTVGTSVSCFELAGAITQESPGIFVHNLETKISGSFSNDEILINPWEIANIDPSSITVVIT